MIGRPVLGAEANAIGEYEEIQQVMHERTALCTSGAGQPCRSSSVVLGTGLHRRPPVQVQNGSEPKPWDPTQPGGFIFVTNAGAVWATSRQLCDLWRLD